MPNARELIESVADGKADARKVVALKESYNNYHIKASALTSDFLKDAKDLELTVVPAAEDIPIPMDASIELNGNDIVLEGGVDVGGIGEVTLKLGKSKADKYFGIMVSGDEEDVEAILDEHKIKWT